MLIKAENGARPKFCKSFRRERERGRKRETAWKRSSEACLRRKKRSRSNRNRRGETIQKQKGGQWWWKRTLVRCEEKQKKRQKKYSQRGSSKKSGKTRKAHWIPGTAADAQARLLFIYSPLRYRDSMKQSCPSCYSFIHYSVPQYYSSIQYRTLRTY